MYFLSTRDLSGSLHAPSHAVLQGLAADGGLYVPAHFPQLSWQDWYHASYADVAFQILSAYLTDFPREELRSSVRCAYGETNTLSSSDTELRNEKSCFVAGSVAPVTALGPGRYLLELYHGPTLAFKDVALQLLPHLMRMACARQEQLDAKGVLILAATSGDTGKAAMEGFSDVPGTRAAVYYPTQGVSAAQKLQMTTQRGDNVFACAIDGNFDDAQRGVKALFNDEGFLRTCAEKGWLVSSANSINIGRLLPQIAYYFWAYLELWRRGALRPGDPVRFAVPTGNFGNILAAEYARRMGLPIEKLICASNANRVLDDFFRTGRYDADRELVKTSSPSMDILVSSNLERLLYLLHGAEKLRSWMDGLSGARRYDIGAAREELSQHFASGYADEAQTHRAIRRAWTQDHTLIDPHTAASYHVADTYAQDDIPLVVVSTASPYKFAPAVLQALGELVADEQAEDWADCAARLAQNTGTEVPLAIRELAELPVRHRQTCGRDAESMRQALNTWLDQDTEAAI